MNPIKRVFEYFHEQPGENLSLALVFGTASLACFVVFALAGSVMYAGIISALLLAWGAAHAVWGITVVTKKQWEKEERQRQRRIKGERRIKGASQ